MDQFKVQSLIAQGQIVKAEDVNPDKAYLQVGVFQEGNRQIGPGNANAYAPYAIPLSEVGCNDNVYNTGIFDEYPWIIQPTMVPSCTKINDYPVFPTAFASNLEGYKIVGTTFMYDQAYYVEYIGTVEITDEGSFSGFGLLPWKTSGTVTAFDDNLGQYSVSAFANGALIQNATSLGIEASKVMTIVFEPVSPTQYDFYLLAAAGGGTNMNAEAISFQFEFVAIEGATVTFKRY